jgi:hypothetical protein
MIRCNWDGSGAGDSGGGIFEALRLDGWSYTTDFFIRYWFRVDNDMRGGTGPKVMRIGNPNHIASFLDCPASPGSQYFGGFFGFSDWMGGNVESGTCGGPNWHKVELYFHVASSGGVVTMWVDDVQVWQATGDTRCEGGGRWSQFFISSNWSAGPGCCLHDANNHVYWDEFEIYSDTGTGATGSMSAGTIIQGGANTPPPPQSPTNLRVQ